MAKYVCKKMSTTYIKSSYKGIINPLNIKSTGDHTHTHTQESTIKDTQMANKHKKNQSA